MNCGGVNPGANYDCVSSANNRIWLDRNLGASRVCTAFNDAANDTDATCYGDLYQWGRNTDGHEKRNRNAVDGQIAWNATENTNFLRGNDDWATEDDDGARRTARWAATDGSSICPAGFRVPTSAELTTEHLSWSPQNVEGAFASPLKLPAAGFRTKVNGNVSSLLDGYWSSNIEVSSMQPDRLSISSSSVSIASVAHVIGYSVRCIKPE